MTHKYDFGGHKRNSAAIGWTVFIIVVLVAAAAAWLVLGADFSLW
jgi:hypothetical protein